MPISSDFWKKKNWIQEINFFFSFCYFGFPAIVKEVLVQRLDERVDDMIRRGLLTELAQFHQLYNARRLEQHA